MSCFLAELADSSDFYLEMEYGGDFTWFATGSKTPAVAIEHENRPSGIYGDEIPILLKSAAPLKVLITYVWRDGNPERDKLESLAVEIATKASREIAGTGQELLIVVGLGDVEDAEDWRAFLLAEKGLRPLS